MLEYNVKATGIEDIERLTKAVDGLEGVLTSAKGSGKSLEEVRKIIVGLKGQASVFQELAKAIKEIDPAINKLAGSFDGFGRQITTVLKSEMQHLRGTLQTEFATLATGLGSPLEKKIAKEIGGAIVAGSAEGAEKAKSAAAKVRAEMTAAYEQIVGGDGMKNLSKLELAEVERLKAAGATISKYHSKIISDTKSYITTTENLAQEAATLRLKSAPKRHSEDEVRLLLGLPKRSDMERAAMQHRADLISLQKEIETAARMQVSAATNTPAGTYQSYNPKTGVAGSIKNAEIDAASNALDAQRRADDTFTQAQLANQAKVKEAERKALEEKIANIKRTYEMQQRSHKMEMDRIAAETAAAKKLFEEKVKASAASAINAPVGTYTTYNPSTGKGGKTVDIQVDAASKALDAQRRADDAFTQAQLANEARVRAQEEKSRKERLAHLKYVFEMQQQSHKAEMDRIAAEASAQRKAFEAKVRQSVAAATNNPVGVYQTYTPSTGLKGAVKNQEVVPKETPAIIGKSKVAADDLAAAFNRLQLSGNNVHSMARGLASGFNLLWLTWGNLAPLFAGAAISNGFMQTAKQGMEVANTLAIIERLGENTAIQMQGLTAEMIQLGYNGPRGPKEIAEAFKVLSLAGLKANEVLAVTKTVMDFSTAGDTDLKTAADVLVSVTTAFGTGAAGFAQSADIIARAAADSKASVETFGEAMKTASVVGEIYGGSQEDVALMIQYLAQLGIQGTSAGTAVRNMFSDISGRSGQSVKLLKTLGLEFKDVTTGGVIPLIEQMRQLDQVLSKYDKKSQTNILTALYNERGQKAAAASLQAYRTAAIDSSKYANKLEEDLARLGNAAGESAVNAAYLGQTVEKMYASAGAAFKTSMFQAYQDMEPQLYLMADAFRKAFSSPETIESLKLITGAVADVGVAVAENLETIAKLAVGWGAFRLAAGAVTAAVVLYEAVLKRQVANKLAAAGATEAMTAAEKRYAAAVAASGAASAASSAAAAGRLASVLKVLPVVGNLVALGSVAWMLYDSAMARAGTTSDEYALTKSKNILQALRDENKQLEAVNAKRLQGIGLAEAEAAVKAENEKNSIAKKGREEDAEIEAKILSIRKELASIESKNYRANDEFANARKEYLQNELNGQARILEGKRRERVESQKLIDQETERLRTNRKNAELIAKAEMQSALNAAPKIDTGSKTFDLADWQDSMRKQGRGPGKASQYYDEEFELFKKKIDAQKELVSTLYDQGKIDAGSYYDWLTFRANSYYEMERKALAQKASELQGDPKSEKEYKKALTELAALDLKYTADAVKLEYDRNKAISERLTPMEQIAAEGKSRLEKASQNTGDLIGITSGGLQAERQRAILQIEQSYSDMRLQVQKRYNTDAASLSEEGLSVRQAQRDAELAEIQKYADKEVEIYKQKEARKDEERKSYSNGVKRAYEDYMASATDYASQAANATKAFMSTAEDAFVNFVKTGKMGWESFANVAIEQLARIAAQQLTGSLGTILGNFGSSLMAVFNAQGGVYDSPSLSKYSNQVHSTPKVFAFAKGAGVFGEAGPEAIMPLTRGPDGNLGVRTYKGSGSGESSYGSINITTNVYADGTSKSSTTSSLDSTASKVLGDALNVKIKSVLAKELGQGGMIWRAVNGR